MQTANATLNEMVGAMAEITCSSDRIAKIIKVIDEVAFQTNILALNAAVEAARAGEAGMGFAVVADEVRSLAQRCAQAARDTAELIEESISKSNGGKLKLDQVAEAIHSITESAVKVRMLVDEVSHATQEQSHGIDQITAGHHADGAGYAAGGGERRRERLGQRAVECAIRDAEGCCPRADGTRRSGIAAPGGAGFMLPLTAMLTRREMLAAIATISAAAQQARSGGGFAYLSREDAADIEAMAAEIIPTDDLPGAREAGVIWFIDGALAGYHRDQQTLYREGLADLRGAGRGGPLPRCRWRAA